jgi:hypothetical protein
MVTRRLRTAALRALAMLSGGDLLSGDSPDGRVWAVGAATGHKTTILVANLHDDERSVELSVEGRVVTVTVPARAFVSARV